MVRLLVAAALLMPSGIRAADWPMGGRDNTRNPVSLDKGAPIDWQVKTKEEAARNIKWSAKVGTWSIGGPVVANGLIWVGTNNSEPLDPSVQGDRGVLACFRESDGKFLYHYASTRLALDRYGADFPFSSHSGSPVTENERLWFVNNRREVICLDTGPLQRDEGPAKVLWKYDLVKEQGVFPSSPMLPSHNNNGSPAIYKDLLFVPTGNGVGVDHPGAVKVRNPDAPSLVCFHKETGKIVWKDNSPGKEAYGGHHASPLIVEADDKVQVIQPQGDGWVRSFDAWTGKLIWKFDTNRKGAQWKWIRAEGPGKHVVVASPVYAEKHVFFAVGREPEFADGPGRLFCIDPYKEGDISQELEAEEGGGKPNPNSGLIWDYTDDGEDKSSQLHQTIASVAVHEGLVFIPDLSGGIHCLDSKTGKRHWSHEAIPTLFGDPLIVDGRLYCGSENGNVYILEASKNRTLVADVQMDYSIYASLVFANRTLYVLTGSKLYAIGGK